LAQAILAQVILAQKCWFKLHFSSSKFEAHLLDL
jgi:hypothetical protein